MEWSKVPTNLITGDYSDAEILAIVKYQLVFSMIENEPNDKILSKFLTKKQKNMVKNFISDIKTCVENDIKIANNKRNRNRLYYNRHKENDTQQEKNSDGLQADCQPPQTRQDYTRQDNIKKIDPFASPIIEQVFSIYANTCLKLIPLTNPARRNSKLRTLIAEFLEENNSDLQYFKQVCEKANKLEFIVDSRIDLTAILKNHIGIDSGKYIKNSQITIKTTSTIADDTLEFAKKLQMKELANG